MEQSERDRSAGGPTGKVKLKLKLVDAIEGIRALGGELPNMAQLPNSKDIIFFIHSGKRITLPLRMRSVIRRKTIMWRSSEITMGNCSFASTASFYCLLNSLRSCWS